MSHYIFLKNSWKSTSQRKVTNMIKTKKREREKETK